MADRSALHAVARRAHGVRALAIVVIALVVVRVVLDARAARIVPRSTAAAEHGATLAAARDPALPELRSALREIDGLIRQKRFPRAHARAYALLEQPANRTVAEVLTRAATIDFLLGEELRAWYLTVLARRSGATLEPDSLVQFTLPLAAREQKVAALEQALSQPEQADLAVLREFRGVPWVDQLHAQRQNQSAGAILEHARRDYAAAIAPLSAPPVIEVAGIELRLVPAGRFRLGDEWQDGEADEQPSAAAEIARPFYLGTCEVTQAQWQAVMGENPSRGAHAANLPVDSVSLAGVATFLQKTGLRLPTEVEWEYAAKTGTGLKYAIGNLPEDLDRVAWHQQNSGGAAQPVATRAPNAWGFYDLLGNVHEWCATPYAPSPALAVQASQALASGGDPRPRALRGGSWSAAARALRVSARDRCEPTSTGGAIGVRAARDVD